MHIAVPIESGVPVFGACVLNPMVGCWPITSCLAFKCARARACPASFQGMWYFLHIRSTGHDPCAHSVFVTTLDVIFLQQMSTTPNIDG